MQKWLDKNYILIYFTHNEGKSVIAQRFIETIKAKIYKKKWQIIIVNLILLIWINHYKSTYHHSINKKPINADYSDLTKKI